VGRVAIVTDSAADLTPEDAARHGIAVVPLEVSFGQERFRAGVDLTTDEFWKRMTAPEAPFPMTAAASPGQFREAFEAAFSAGAESVVCVDITGTLSGTIKSAMIARDMLPEREIHVVDSTSASMGVGLLAVMGAEMAAAGRPGAEIAEVLRERAADLDLYVAVDSLEYLRKGGRISGATAAIGSLLSFKPIITVRDGQVVPFERVRTRSKAQERCIELLTGRPLERIAVLYAPEADVLAFRKALIARVPGGIDPSMVSVQPIGPSVGPHLGPGCVGAVILHAR
jgi:DegV family protein with EDD domain